METVLPIAPSAYVEGDLALARKLALKDEEAARLVWDLHREGMYRFAYALLGDSDEAADAAQGALLRAMDQAGRYDGRAPLRNWLLTFALRESQRIRRSRRWTRLLPDRADPRTPYASIDAAEALRQGLAGLSPPLRIAFVLVSVEEMTHAEAAAFLQIPEGTVKSRVHAARAALRRSLTP